MERYRNKFRWVLFAAVVGIVAAALSCGAEQGGRPAGDGFQSLTPEKDVGEHWVPEVAPKEIWSVREGDGVIVCKGTPNGYLRTKKKYKNYVFQVEWRYKAEGAPPDANSGIFLNAVEPHKVWPKCVEAQMRQTDAGTVFGLRGGAVTGAKKLEGKARPFGEWNSYEITVRDGNVTLVFNGEKVNEGTDMDPAAGYVCLQSEGWEVHFRNISIKELP